VLFEDSEVSSAGLPTVPVALYPTAYRTVRYDMIPTVHTVRYITCCYQLLSTVTSNCINTVHRCL